MPCFSEKLRWFQITLTIVSILAGLPWGILGCIILPLVVHSLVVGDSAAGHLSQFLAAGLMTFVAGMGTVVSGVYTLIMTRGFQRWGKLSAGNKIVACIAMRSCPA